MKSTAAKLNGVSIGAGPIDLSSMLNPAQYTEVENECQGVTLRLKPIADEVPDYFFTLSRNSNWTPQSNP